MDSMQRLYQSLASGESFDSKQKQFKGKLNPCKVPRQELISYYKQQRYERDRDDAKMRTTTTTITKSSLVKDSCLKHSYELEPIDIKDLIIETVLSGRVVIGRVIVPTIKMNAIQILLEDQNCVENEIIIVSLYNYILPQKNKLSVELDQVFPVGTVIAVKEPYFKVSVSGSFIISIEDPEDLEFIEDPNHPHLTNNNWKQSIISKLPKDIDGWRVQGNDSYNKQNYEQALRYYNGGLTIDPKHSILSLNKMAVLAQLKRYHECIPIGLSLLPVLVENEKLYARLGKSYYYVGLYEKSIEIYQKLLHFQPKCDEAITFIGKCKDRLIERDQGIYNCKKIKDEYIKTKQVECAEYIGPIKITSIEGKGRGIILTKDIPAGTLLIVSRGVGVYKVEEEGREFALSANLGNKTANTMEQMKVISSTINTIKTNPFVSNLLLKLYAGPTFTQSTSSDVTINDFKVNQDESFTSSTRASIEQIKGIVKYNSFQEPDITQINGLWLLPSLINHSCLPNCHRFCIGETMFITSSKNLKMGEELFLAYVSMLDTYHGRTNKLESFGFICKCKLCEMDKLETEASMKERERLAERFTELKPKIKEGPRLVNTTLPLLEKHIETVKKTYLGGKGRQLALDLFMPVTAQAMLYQIVSHDKALKAYIECMKILGFDMDIDYSKETLSKSDKNFKVKYQGSLDHQHMDIFIHITIQALSLGYHKLSRQSLALSRLCGKIALGLAIPEHLAHYEEAQFPVHLFPFKDTIQLLDK